MKTQLFNKTKKNDINDLIFYIDEKIFAKLWQESQSKFSLPGNQLIAYINRICQEIILDYIREECSEANICYNQEPLWELGINGSAINLDKEGKQRLIIIPSEDFETRELFVHAEWIDIPNLLGDYYLAVQVDLEEELLKIWAYTTHAEIKKNADYIERDIAYSLAKKYLISAPDFLWSEREVYPNQVTRGEVKPLPILSTSAINQKINQSNFSNNFISYESYKNYLVRLGNPDKLFPRKELKFETWATLLQDEQWRKNLYNFRLGIPEEWSIFDWLKNGIPETAQKLGWLLLNLPQKGVIAKGSIQATSDENIESQINTSFCIANQYKIAGQNYELQIHMKSDIDGNICTFTLINLAIGGLIPGGFKLKLLTDDLQPFPDNEVVAETAQAQLEISVSLEQGEKLICEIEPFPDNYHRQILKF